MIFFFLYALEILYSQNDCLNSVPDGTRWTVATVLIFLANQGIPPTQAWPVMLSLLEASDPNIFLHFPLGKLQLHFSLQCRATDLSVG